MIPLTDENFKETIASTNVCLVDIWATWCGPCRMQGPIVHEIADEYEDRAGIFMMNVDDAPETTEELEIINIPMILFYKDGKHVTTMTGLQTKGTLTKELDKLI